MQKVKKREVSSKILCRDTQELVGDWKGTGGVCAGPHNYIYWNIQIFELGSTIN
jgi:hypothetical protein